MPLLRRIFTNPALGLACLTLGLLFLAVGALAAGLEDEAHPDIDFTIATELDGTVGVYWAGRPINQFFGSRQEAEAWIENNPPVREDYTTAYKFGAIGGILFLSGVAVITARVRARHRKL